MASTKGTSEDFPGAYSGQGRSWELKTKEAIELLPDKYGFQPKVVLAPRAPPTIMATAVDVSATATRCHGNDVGFGVSVTSNSPDL